MGLSVGFDGDGFKLGCFVGDVGCVEGRDVGR